MIARLKDRRIIVFGGGSGIGAATVKRLAGEGARVCTTDINLANAEAVAADAGAGVFALHVDISDEALKVTACDICARTATGREGLRERALAVCAENLLWPRYIPTLRHAYGLGPAPTKLPDLVQTVGSNNDAVLGQYPER